MTDSYPDFPPDTLGDLKSIERHPKMQPTAPKIRWGDEYRAWPIEKRLSFAERLASTMNHAADVLQTERNELLATLTERDREIVLLKDSYSRQSAIVQHEVGQQNAREQELNQTIVSLQQELKKTRRRVKELEDVG